jgi:Rod binding domain-containing protein
MYFEMMLKSAFKMSTYDGEDTTGIGMYTDLYLQNMAAEFSENHNLGFGQLQLINESTGENS